MILLTNFTREHVNKEIGDHYRERFFRRVQWITIEHQKFYKLFTEDEHDELKGIK